MKAHIVIRAAVAQDAKALTQIERHCFDPAIYGHLLLSETKFSHMIARSRSRLIVAEVNGSVVGYAAVIFLRSKHLTWFYSHAVELGFRGIGIGTRLFRHAEALAIANDCPCMVLEILKKTELFERYKRYGYKVVREIPGFYPDGSTAIRMSSRLSTTDTAVFTMLHRGLQE